MEQMLDRNAILDCSQPDFFTTKSDNNKNTYTKNTYIEDIYFKNTQVDSASAVECL